MQQERPDGSEILSQVSITCLKTCVSSLFMKEEDVGKHPRVLSFKEVFHPRVKLSKKHLFGEQSQALV
ncbi:hypothetical protein E2320_013454, partial [Naja naja]